MIYLDDEQNCPQAGCFYKKTVGDADYTLIKGNAEDGFGCKDSCVYEMDLKPGTRFCFKDETLSNGGLSVTVRGKRSSFLFLKRSTIVF